MYRKLGNIQFTENKLIFNISSHPNIIKLSEHFPTYGILYVCGVNCLLVNPLVLTSASPFAVSSSFTLVTPSATPATSLMAATAAFSTPPSLVLVEVLPPLPPAVASVPSSSVRPPLKDSCSVIY